MFSRINLLNLLPLSNFPREIPEFRYSSTLVYNNPSGMNLPRNNKKANNVYDSLTKKLKEQIFNFIMAIKRNMWEHRTFN